MTFAIWKKLKNSMTGSHASKPHNPDIARVFYRAGYIENWGRGIQKIRDACKAHGAEKPEYFVHAGDIMVKLKALQSAIVTDSKVPHVTMDGCLNRRWNIAFDQG